MSPRFLWSRQRLVAVPWASERKRRICNYSLFPTASSLPQRPLSNPPSSPCVSSSLSFRSRAPTLIFMLLHDWDAEERVARSRVILLFLLCCLPVCYLHHLFSFSSSHFLLPPAPCKIVRSHRFNVIPLNITMQHIITWYEAGLISGTGSLVFASPSYTSYTRYFLTLPSRLFEPIKNPQLFACFPHRRYLDWTYHNMLFKTTRTFFHSRARVGPSATFDPLREECIWERIQAKPFDPALR